MLDLDDADASFRQPTDPEKKHQLAKQIVEASAKMVVGQGYRSDSEDEDEAKYCEDCQNLEDEEHTRCATCRGRRDRRLSTKYEYIIPYWDGENYPTLFRAFNVMRSDYNIRD